MGATNKQEVITFKVDDTLAAALSKIQNRSEFIRRALLLALDSHCPLCSGTGVLTPHQKKHWEDFSQNHRMELCDSCQEYHLVCDADNQE